MTILLVEDDEDDQDIFREGVKLVKPGCKLLIAQNGEEGLTILQAGNPKPDYIFLDVNMPKMDGRAFLKSVKSDPLYSKIPVVIYSTNNNKSELGEYFKLGASNFVTKPSEFELLVTYLKTILH